MKLEEFTKEKPDAILKNKLSKAEKLQAPTKYHLKYSE